MAQWSEAAEIQRKLDALAPVLAERAELFKKFRAAGWQVYNVMPQPNGGTLPDNEPRRDLHFRVKPPHAALALIRSVDQLHRLALGL